MQVKIDPLAERPRVEQLTDGIRRWIERHGAPGERLPSIRRLAATQGVSRNMVIEAYERLVALGWIVSRPGSGFYVADGAVDATEREARSGMADVSDEMWHLFQPEGESLRLGCGWLPTAWRNEEAFAHALRQVTRQSSTGLFEYGTPLGSPELRVLVQERLRGLAIEVDANQLLTTGGGSQALEVIVRWMLRPGDTVLVESPGYYNLFGLLHLHRVNVVGVRRTEEGPDPAHLEALLERHSPGCSSAIASCTTPRARPCPRKLPGGCWRWPSDTTCGSSRTTSTPISSRRPPRGWPRWMASGESSTWAVSPRPSPARCASVSSPRRRRSSGRWST